MASPIGYVHVAVASMELILREYLDHESHTYDVRLRFLILRPYRGVAGSKYPFEFDPVRRLAF
jgi:hypothetical protein